MAIILKGLDEQETTFPAGSAHSPLGSHYCILVDLFLDAKITMDNPITHWLNMLRRFAGQSCWLRELVEAVAIEVFVAIHQIQTVFGRNQYHLSCGLRGKINLRFWNR